MSDPHASRPAPPLHPQVCEIIAYAKGAGLNPVNLVFDFFREKDARISLRECRRIMERYEAASIHSLEEDSDG